MTGSEIEYIQLHMNLTRYLADLLDDYIRECYSKGIYEIKIIHGKGKGILRDRIHSLLRKHPLVKEYHLDKGPSGWGASIAYLKPNHEKIS